MATTVEQTWENNSGNSSVASIAVTVSGVTANNLLVVAVGVQSGDVTGLPTGFVEIHDESSGSNFNNGGLFYKYADGTEGTLTFSLASGTTRMSIAAVEYSGLAASGGPDATDEDSTYVSADNSGTGYSPGSVTPSSQPGRVITGHFCRRVLANYVGGDLTINDSFSVDESASHTSAARPQATIASRDFSATSAISPTWTHTDTNGRAYANIAAFLEPSGGGSDTEISASTETLALTTYPASVAFDVNVGTATESLALTTYPATVSLDVDVQTGTETLSLTTYQATVDLAAGIVTNTASLALTTYPATVSLDVDVQASTETLTLTTYPASIVTGVEVTTNLETLALTTYPATISLDRNVQASTATLTLTTYQATIDTGQLQVTCRLVDTEGNALPNLTSLSYAWFDESDPADFTSPVVQGGVESTDSLGNIVVPIGGTSLTAGGVGTLVLRSDDGTLFGAYNLAAAA